MVVRKRLDGKIPVKKTMGANGGLSRLFTTITNDLNISWMNFERLLDSYVRDARNGIPANRKDMTSAKGNLVKFVTGSQMTWKTFIRSMRVLQMVKLEIIIRATHVSGRTTEHSTPIEFGDDYEVVEFERRLNQDEESELRYEPTTNLPWPNDDDYESSPFDSGKGG